MLGSRVAAHPAATVTSAEPPDDPPARRERDAAGCRRSQSATRSMALADPGADAARLLLAEHVARGHRRDEHAHEVRRDHGDGDGEGERREELLGEAREEQHRKEDGDRRQRRREHRQRDGVRALERRVEAIEPLLLVAVNRFQHDDRVVDEPPHRERQSAEREGVQGLPGRVERDERDREREGDRDGHDESAAHALEEQEDDERDEHERLENLALETRVRRLHVRRLVEDGLHDHPRREGSGARRSPSSPSRRSAACCLRARGGCSR